MKKFLLSTFAALVAPSIAFAQQLAFPTAEGFGKYAQGGRGGQVMFVDNLNDAGPGSLRACIEGTGPRTCVFRVAGEIKPQSKINCASPYLTIAGQTAPGGGVMLTTRNSPNLNQPLGFQCDHVILRHLRIRPGVTAQPSSNGDAILIDGSNIILDHVTTSWGTDETFNIIGNSGFLSANQAENSSDITVQWSMIYESLNCTNHPQGCHGRSTYIGYGVQNLSFHHNVIAHAVRRNANLGVLGQIDWVNNVHYNGQDYFNEWYSRHGTPHFNVVGNVCKKGPNTPAVNNRYCFNFFDNDVRGGGRDFYLLNNLDMNGSGNVVLDPKDLFLVKPAPVGSGQLSIAPASISGADQAYKDVLAFAGAFPRDTADARVVGNIQNCTGAIIDDPSQVGGWPVLASGTAPADADNDGMPNAWETAHGFNPAVANNNADEDGDGYTDLEEYLNELAGDQDAAGVNINVVGTGAGPATNPTCGATLANAVGPRINSFTVKRPGGAPVGTTYAAPGGAVEIAFNLENPAGSCNGGGWSFPFSGQSLPSGVVSGTVTHTVSTTPGFYLFDMNCTKSKADDWKTAGVFVTAGGAPPVPTLNMTMTPLNPSSGASVTASWVMDTLRNSTAGECITTGPAPWGDRYEAVTGARSFVPVISGDYGMTCTGELDGAAFSKSKVFAVVVNGSPPPAPPVISIAVSPMSANEGSGANGALYTFNITRTGDISAQSVVNFDEEGVGANPASVNDFTSSSYLHGQIVFAPGEATKQRFKIAAGDVTPEADETFQMRLSAPQNATLGTAVAIATIENDDVAPPVFTITPLQATVSEGNSGPTATYYTVARSGDLSQAGTVTFIVTGEAFGGNPAAGCSDFPSGICVTGTVTLAANEAAKNFGVNVKGDTVVEPNEGFAVTISAPTIGTIGAPNKAQVTIINDDSAGGSGAGALALGANVEISRSPYTQVRSAPQGSQAGTQVAGADGRIIGGPVNRNAIDWWQVDFAEPPDGWVEAKYLRLR